VDLLELTRRRRDLLRAVRRFFDELDFVEVETPLLIPANAPEPHIDAVPVEVRLAPDGPEQRLYLRTSPELALKRLVAAGAERIYEIARVARDADHDAMHRIEFTLLEWYRAGATYQTLMDDCDGLLRSCTAALGAGPMVQGPAGACDLSLAAERLSVAEAFERHAGFDPSPYLGGDAQGLFRAATAVGIALPAGPAGEDPADFETVFFAAFLSAVEPHLGLGRPTILFEWPAPLAALARLGPGRPALGLRMELYAGGVELANGFDELVDPIEQRRRFQAAQAQRQAAGRDPYPAAEAFLTDLGKLPPTAGIALGLERLLMLLTDAPELASAGLPWGW